MRQKPSMLIGEDSSPMKTEKMPTLGENAESLEDANDSGDEENQVFLQKW